MIRINMIISEVHQYRIEIMKLFQKMNDDVQIDSLPPPPTQGCNTLGGERGRDIVRGGACARSRSHSTSTSSTLGVDVVSINKDDIMYTHKRCMTVFANKRREITAAAATATRAHQRQWGSRCVCVTKEVVQQRGAHVVSQVFISRVETYGMVGLAAGESRRVISIVCA